MARDISKQDGPSLVDSLRETMCRLSIKDLNENADVDANQDPESIDIDVLVPTPAEDDDRMKDVTELDVSLNDATSPSCPMTVGIPSTSDAYVVGQNSGRLMGGIVTYSMDEECMQDGGLDDKCMQNECMEEERLRNESIEDEPMTEGSIQDEYAHDMTM
nr:hypothetical protein CFP56_32276 [Quercus suber]